MPANVAIAPISLADLVREYYAAKLDISIANSERREAADLNFREFLRCIERIALAMHVRNPSKHDAARANGVTTTVFEATKDDTTRSPEKVCTPRSPRYQRRGNMLAATSPTKNCKIASTSVISRLLQTSRALVMCPLPKSNQAPSNESESSVPTAPSASNNPAQLNPSRPPCSHQPRRRPLTSGGPPRIRVIQRPPM
jgi:hypothetical protein